MRKILILAAFGLAETPAIAQEPPETAAEPAPELRALADSCDAHKFETTVIVDGSRGKRVKICGKPGQTNAEWLVTLKDSARKVAADTAMTQPVKDQIIAALKVEIGRLETLAAAAAGMPVATIDLPASPVVAPEAQPQYSSVPPLPAPKPRLTGALAAAASAPIVRPRLTLRCALPRETFEACARLERETQLSIRADEDIAGGTSLRFLRGGDNRAEFDLGPLKKGQMLREKLPGRVCSGTLRGKVQVQILSKNQVAETLGPYALYCGS